MNRLYYFFLLVTLSVTGCKLDNYDPPSSPLTGRLVFEGKPVGIKQGISVLQLYQPGFEKVDPIKVNVRQDGSFSSMLFDGSYRLIRVAGNGPWENNPDTITVDVKGATEIDVPVTPYFSISDAAFAVENGVLKATFQVKNNVAGRQLERVSLFVGKTTLVDEIYRLAPPNPGDPLSTKAGSGLDLSQTITLSQSLSMEPIASETNLYARVGVKTVGVPEMIFSDVFKVNK